MRADTPLMEHIGRLRDLRHELRMGDHHRFLIGIGFGQKLNGGRIRPIRCAGLQSRIGTLRRDALGIRG